MGYMFCHVVGIGVCLLLVAIYDRTALDYTQKISLPASPSVEIRVCIGTHMLRV